MEQYCVVSCFKLSWHRCEVVVEHDHEVLVRWNLSADAVILSVVVLNVFDVGHGFVSEVVGCAGGGDGERVK